jgi:hypothetical protein
VSDHQHGEGCKKIIRTKPHKKTILIEGVIGAIPPRSPKLTIAKEMDNQTTLLGAQFTNAR